MSGGDKVDEEEVKLAAAIDQGTSSTRCSVSLARNNEKKRGGGRGREKGERKTGERTGACSSRVHEG